MAESDKAITDSNPIIVEVEIVNKKGLHARASAKFVELANSFNAKILVSKDKLEVLGNSIMGLLLLTASKGEIITIKATGDDAQEAINELCQLVKNKFEEED